MAATYFQRNPAKNAPVTRTAKYVNAVPKSGCIRTNTAGSATSAASLAISQISNSSVFRSVRYRATNNIITSLTNSDTCK